MASRDFSYFYDNYIIYYIGHPLLLAFCTLRLKSIKVKNVFYLIMISYYYLISNQF